MRSVKSRQGDRHLWFAIACFTIGGPIVTVVAIWILSESDTIDRGSRGLIVLAVLGLAVLSIGGGELVHRVRHGRQQPGRHVSPDHEQEGV